MDSPVEWNPDPTMLQNIGNFLLSSAENAEAQAAVAKEVEQWRHTPEASLYLAYLFGKLPDSDISLRMIAGLVLKNVALSVFPQLPAQGRLFVQQQTLHTLIHPEAGLRKTAGTVVTSITRVSSFTEWPGLLQYLTSALGSPHVHHIDGALGALEKMCIDSSYKMYEEDAKLGSPLNLLIPALLRLFSSEHAKFRKMAVNCVNRFIQTMPSVLAANFDDYLKAMFTLADDSSAKVRTMVVRGLSLLTETKTEMVWEHLENIIRYMIVQTAHEDEELSLAACDFWTALCDTLPAKSTTEKFLPEIFDVLLTRTEYSEDELIMIEIEAESVEKPEDVKPWIAGASSHGEAAIKDEHPDSDSIYNIRRSAATSLDLLSSRYEEKVLPILLPQLTGRLESSDWKKQESGLLTLGAIAEGCERHLTEKMPDIIPFIVGFMGKPEPLLRSIACWSTTQYSHWIANENEDDTYLGPVIEQLALRLSDPHKKVRQAAVSGLAVLTETAGMRMVPYAKALLHHYFAVFDKYCQRNLLILYDAVATLADRIKGELNKPELIQIMMPPLWTVWTNCPDFDRALLPLFECIHSVCAALGEGYFPYVEATFARCLLHVHATLSAIASAAQNGTDAPELEFLIGSLDLLSGVVEGLGTHFVRLASGSEFFPLLIACIESGLPDIKQSAFGLVGDMAKHCFDVIAPMLESFVTHLAGNMDPSHRLMCNNAIWSLGEIVLKAGPDVVNQFAVALGGQLIELINKRGLRRSIQENSAICLGRLGLVCPDALAPNVESFLRYWCLTVRDVNENDEKLSAFLGIINVVKRNPEGALKFFAYLCDAIVSYRQPPDVLLRESNELIMGFHNSMAAGAWGSMTEQWPPNLRKAIHKRFGV